MGRKREGRNDTLTVPVVASSSSKCPPHPMGMAESQFFVPRNNLSAVKSSPHPFHSFSAKTNLFCAVQSTNMPRALPLSPSPIDICIHQIRSERSRAVERKLLFSHEAGEKRGSYGIKVRSKNAEAQATFETRARS